MRDVASCGSIDELTRNDVIDSRDLVDLLERLKDDVENDKTTHEEEEEQAKQEAEEEGAVFTPTPFDEDEDRQALIKALEELKEECEGSGWRDGIGFIRSSYWKDYCEQLASDFGYIKQDGDRNPLLDCIDWEKWADMVAVDYHVIDIGDTEYYWREA